MIYGSVCSGIEAATVAWHPLGWKPAFFSEIEGFPRAALQHHYPEVPLHGDFTTIGEDDYGSIELLVGGTPCQSFSVAGLRGGLDDERGNLALEFLKLAQRKNPRWIVWENVPGVLSSGEGRDFGAFLGGLVELGYGFAYRVLDAQYFGVAQRRRRVFVVGYLGDWRPAAAVLFEPESLRGHPAPSRETGQAIARGSISRALTSSSTATGRLDPNEQTFVVNALANTGVGTCGADDNQAQAGHLIPQRQVANAVTANDSNDPNDKTYVVFQANATADQAAAAGDNVAPTMATSSHSQPAVAFMENQRGEIRTDDVTDSLKGSGGKPGQGYQAAIQNMQVRRLTPVECERLQGFPDNYTQIPWRKKAINDCPDGPRYKALGNSMAVPVMRWIGERIEAVEKILEEIACKNVLAEMNCGPQENAHESN